MMAHALKLRSASGRKLTTGLGLRNSQKINPIRPVAKRMVKDCTRQNGSPNCPASARVGQEAYAAVVEAVAAGEMTPGDGATVGRLIAKYAKLGGGDMRDREVSDRSIQALRKRMGEIDETR